MIKSSEVETTVMSTACKFKSVSYMCKDGCLTRVCTCAAEGNENGKTLLDDDPNHLAHISCFPG